MYLIPLTVILYHNEGLSSIGRAAQRRQKPAKALRRGADKVKTALVMSLAGFNCTFS